MFSFESAQRGSLLKIALPQAVQQWICEDHHCEPDRLNLDNIIEEFVSWYTGMQPTQRFRGVDRTFGKMKGASDVNSELYSNMRSNTQQGIVALVHCIAWMFDCQWPTVGPLSRISIWDIVDDVSAIFKVLLTYVLI